MTKCTVIMSVETEVEIDLEANNLDDLAKKISNTVKYNWVGFGSNIW